MTFGPFFIVDFFGVVRAILGLLFLCSGMPFDCVWAQGKFPEVPAVQELPKGHWQLTIEPIPSAPNYASLSSWACLPSFISEDMAGMDGDHVWSGSQMEMPRGHQRKTLSILDAAHKADVFFLHPTLLLTGEQWNADVGDAAMNAQVDKWPIRHQASAFEGAGRVFAPRYRQAHVRIFSLGDSLSWAAAEVAYEDIKASFEHYLKHWNQGRPIIVAGHSQGSFHGRRLLQEFFDGKALHSNLVAAYLPGMDMYADEFQSIDQCHSPADIGCLCTWMTYAKGFVPDWLQAKRADLDRAGMYCTHPVTWRSNKNRNLWEEHLGALRPSFRLSKSGAVRAHINSESTLWIDEPNILGAKMLRRENWHSGDINLFWVNIHENAVLRVSEWYAQRPLLDKPHSTKAH